jgi:mannose-6-phosphate isomerase-like protein (cupin superfamily)
MDPFDQQRRSLLVALAGLGIGPLLPQLPAAAPPGVQRGSVLSSAEGEHLVHFRDRGNIFIKVGAATGSGDLAVGTQQVMVGTGIPLHRHFRMDEAFYVLEGSGKVVLGDVPHAFDRGASIFIPKNTWHGFENPRHELQLLWIVSPAGLDGFFRDTCSPPGAPAKSLSRDQIRKIARRYDTEFR